MTEGPRSGGGGLGVEGAPSSHREECVARPGHFGSRRTVTDAAGPSRFALSNTSGPFALDRTYEFKPNCAGCTVSFSFDMRPKAAMRLAFPLLRNTIAAQVKANIGRLPSAAAEVGEV